jgi:ferritin-like metal-binding protein YciE
MEGSSKKARKLSMSKKVRRWTQGLISVAQHVEHYEIAAYGCVRTYANLLGEEDAAELLEQTLKEEKQTDQELTKTS